jgi:hypothetical protein
MCPWMKSDRSAETFMVSRFSAIGSIRRIVI